MRFLDKMVKKIPLRIPICEYCKNFKKYEDGRLICKAYPDGVPAEIDVYSEDIMKQECANGYRFEEQ